MYLEDAIIADNIKPVSNIPPARNSSLVQGWVNKFNDISSKLHCTSENVTEQQKNAEKHSIDQDPAVEYPAYLLHMQERLSLLQNILNDKSPLATCVKWYSVKDDECIWVELIAAKNSQLHLVDKDGNDLKDDSGGAIKLYGIAGDFDEACDKLLEKLYYLDRGYTLKAVEQ